jgi:hypothetical protein
MTADTDKKYEYSEYEGVLLRKASDVGWGSTERYKSGEWSFFGEEEDVRDTPGYWWSMSSPLTEAEANKRMASKD